MTLILNEIHLVDGFDQTILVSAADTRITYRGRWRRERKYGHTKKLFEIPYLRATVSYYGIPCIPGGKGYVLHSSWIPNFIASQHHTTELGTFARNLRQELNQRIPPNWLQNEPSGVHILGYGKGSIPEFWYFTNARWDEGQAAYKDVQGCFGVPTPDFLGRDALALGWDRNDRNSVAGIRGVQSYRNGDFRVHEALWTKLDEVFSELDAFSAFKFPKGKAGLRLKAKFKFELISKFYQEWGKTKLVGGPPTVWVDSEG